MKFFTHILFLIVSSFTYAGGAPGYTDSCKSGNIELIKGTKANGIGEFNPFDLHKNVLILKIDGKKVFKEKYEYIFQTKNYQEFDYVLEASGEICRDVSDIETGYLSNSATMVYCEGSNNASYYILNVDEEIYVFDSYECKERMPVLF